MQQAFDEVLEWLTAFESAESNAALWLALLAVAAALSLLCRWDDFFGRRRAYDVNDEIDPFGFNDAARDFDLQRYISSRDD